MWDKRKSWESQINIIKRPSPHQASKWSWEWSWLLFFHPICCDMPFLPHHFHGIVLSDPGDTEGFCPISCWFSEHCSHRGKVGASPQDAKASSTVFGSATVASLTLYCLLAQKNLWKPFPAWLMRLLQKVPPRWKAAHKRKSSLFSPPQPARSSCQAGSNFLGMFWKADGNKGLCHTYVTPHPSMWGKLSWSWRLVGLRDTQNWCLQ